MRLSGLLEAAERAGLAADPEIVELTADSRLVEPGWLFAALPGTQVDGARFIPDALAAGAAAILAADTAETPPGCAVPVLRAADPRTRLALMSARFYAPHPGIAVAVTGTNGKTSVASFTEQIWRALGRPAASIGTLGVSGAKVPVEVALTSPDPVSLHRVLRGLAAAGIDHVALEASSHGLEQRRLEGLKLAGAAFTNISRDHLDYHPSFEAYLGAKLRLLGELLPPGRLAVVNRDGAGAAEAERVAAARGHRLATVGRGGDTVRLAGLSARLDGLDLAVETEAGRREIKLKLVGGFQAENALVAAALATADGQVKLADALGALPGLIGARGRLEHVADTGAGAAVFVDYAHTPAALETVLAALRAHVAGRLIVVFGAGGDRDRGKRGPMGAAVAAGADIQIVTDDNPRGEDAAAIRAAVLAGAPQAREIGDRRAAIAEAIAAAVAGDIVLVAGKGHETGQKIGEVILPFSDHEVIAELVGAEAAG
jgi:UDP-N-acetylmuramoyl-L-alanyl-D-glutamate--2,6-diaminopimelate ligase